jgi:hypothetical protein
MRSMCHCAPTQRPHRARSADGHRFVQCRVRRWTKRHVESADDAHHAPVGHSAAGGDRSGFRGQRTLEPAAFHCSKIAADFRLGLVRMHALTSPAKPADIVPFLTINKLPPGDYSLRLRTESGWKR